VETVEHLNQIHFNPDQDEQNKKNAHTQTLVPKLYSREVQTDKIDFTEIKKEDPIQLDIRTTAFARRLTFALTRNAADESSKARLSTVLPPSLN
jgi:hypothetical protein